MEVRRRSESNRIILEIKTAENFVSRSKQTITRLKSAGPSMGVEFVAKQIEKLKIAIEEKEDLLKLSVYNLRELTAGLLDDELNEEYKKQTEIAKRKTQETLKIKADKRKEKKKDKDESDVYWKDVISSQKSSKQTEKDIKYGWKYYNKVIDQVPDYMERNLADMPNNKGYIWRGIHFYGHKKEQQGVRVMFEKQKGNILIIHEYTNTEYRRYEKEGKNKKYLVFSQMKRNKGLNTSSILDYKK